MLMRADSLRDFDRLAQQATGTNQGTPARSTAMPMDAYREGSPFTVFFDLPGVDPTEINLNVERNVLTVRAERSPTAAGEGVEMQIFGHPTGLISQQLFLRETLNAERIEVDYAHRSTGPAHSGCGGAKPRRIAIGGPDGAPRTSIAPQQTASEQ